jgi:uncharacterized protein YihD (DUF1040 family)
VIHENHQKAHEIRYDNLLKIAQELDIFGDIYTLNYDLYLYSIIMASVDRSNKIPTVKAYQDYFWSRWQPPFLEFMDFQNYPYKHAYYLHGALFIFPGWFYNHHNTLKIRRSDRYELLDVIRDQISIGSLPLFVSEGTSNDKLRIISDNTYLSFARSKLKSSSDKMVIYGCSLSRDQDQHIIEALNAKKRDIACSIFVGGKDYVAVKEEIHDLKSKLAFHEVIFFDSSTLFSLS